MKHRSWLVVLTALCLLPMCQKSEISDKPAAEVSESISTAAPAQPVLGAVTANVIKEKSSIDFVGAKVTGDHKGKFPNFDGRIEYSGAMPSAVSFEIDLATLETDTPKLTAHLKTADFFDVAKYPKATFVSTSITPVPAGDATGKTHEVKGVLDLHGMKKEVTIPVKASVTPAEVVTTSEFTINRHDWGISYRGAADDLIRDDVLIKLNLVFPPPPAG